MKSTVDGINEASIQGTYILVIWLKWLKKMVDLYGAKSALVAKRASAKKAKEKLAEIHAQLDAAGMDSPFSLALMHTVAQAAKELGAPMRRDQLVWVLQRAKGNERIAISIAIAQANARRALEVLRRPELLASFDAASVSAVMVRKVKESLKAEGLRLLLAELDAADEAAGEAYGHSKAGGRPVPGGHGGDPFVERRGGPALRGKSGDARA